MINVNYWSELQIEKAIYKLRRKKSAELKLPQAQIR